MTQFFASAIAFTPVVKFVVYFWVDVTSFDIIDVPRYSVLLPVDCPVGHTHIIWIDFKSY
eukprot:6045057-Ditylum_brightwellii.AAC.1